MAHTAHTRKNTTHAATSTNKTTAIHAAATPAVMAVPQDTHWLRGEQKLHAVLPDLLAVSADDRTHRLLPAFDLVVGMRRWLLQAETLRARMDDLLKKPPFAEMDSLPSLLDVAEHLSLGIKPSSAQQNLKTLLGETLIPARKTLRTMIEPLVLVGAMSADVLEQTRDGRSTMNVAEDVLRLVAALQAAWPAIQGKTPLDLAAIADHEAQARKALDPHTGVRPVVLQSEVAVDRDVLLDRTLVLILQRYTSVRDAVSYVRAREGDADAFTPSPYVIRGGGRPRKTARPAATAEPTADAEPPDDTVKPAEHTSPTV